MSPMTDPEHEHTAQEQLILDHMLAGEWDLIQDLRDDAAAAAVAGDPSAAGPNELDVFLVDHVNATAHYQDQHEAPESEREDAARQEATAGNVTAARGARAG